MGLPLFAYGAAVNFLPYYLPGWLARRMARRETDYATIRLLASVVAFPLFWALETSSQEARRLPAERREFVEGLSSAPSATTCAAVPRGWMNSTPLFGPTIGRVYIVI